MTSSFFTRSGKLLDLSELKPEDIDWQEIADVLSGLERWVRSTRIPVSVLDHSIYVDNLLCYGLSPEDLACIDTRRMRLIVLLHDAHERFLGEIPTWLKDVVPGIRRQADILDRALYRSIGQPPPTAFEHSILKHFDFASQVREATDFISAEAGLKLSEQYGIDPPCQIFQRWGPDGAKEWLRRIREVGAFDRQSTGKGEESTAKRYNRTPRPLRTLEEWLTQEEGRG